jgi:NADP-dependent 3-hydroxy acid dehydrogenase YdfG
MDDFPRPPFPDQQQPVPGATDKMDPRPDHGEGSYKGSGRLEDKKVLITGGDSGIGRAVAIAFAREGADLLVSYLDEHQDAEETRRLVEAAGRTCILMPGDIGKAAHCRALVEHAVGQFGRIDVLVNNAAHQMSFNSPNEISDEEWELTFAVNISAMLYLVKATPHIKPGSAIINTASINSDNPSPHLLAYATTKGAIQNFTGLGAVACRQGNPGQRCRAGAGLDAADSIDHASRACGAFRRELSDQASGPAARVSASLCDAGERRSELCVGNDDRRHRWQADPLTSGRGALAAISR